MEGDPPIVPPFVPCCFISIHALRVEGDPGAKVAISYNDQFLSTPSGWRATFILIQKLRYYFISIHALRVEGDYAFLAW